MSSTNDPIAVAFRKEVKDFLKETKMSPSTFGKKALNDPAFCNGLDAGRDLRLSTMRRVRLWMAENLRDPSVKEAAE